MATGGPYCSQLLLLVLYLSGIRFTTSLNEAEREAKSERYFEILMGLLMVEMRRPTKITTIRTFVSQVCGRSLDHEGSTEISRSSASVGRSAVRRRSKQRRLAVHWHGMSLDLFLFQRSDRH